VIRPFRKYFQRYAGRACLVFCLVNWFGIQFAGPWGVMLEGLRVNRIEYPRLGVSPRDGSIVFVRGIYFDRCGIVIAGPLRHGIMMAGAHGPLRPAQVLCVDELGFALHGPQARNVTLVPSWGRLGFGYTHDSQVMGITTHGASVPWWFLTLVFMIEPLRVPLRKLNSQWISWRAVRLASRRTACRHCGYDLRATPARCPECGNLPTLPDLASPLAAMHVPQP
jgi:hypothetical protein